MLVVCIDNSGVESRFTIGRSYHVAATSNDSGGYTMYYHLEDDLGIWCMGSVSSFVRIEEYRDLQLLKLDI